MGVVAPMTVATSTPNVRVLLTKPPSSHSAYAQLVDHPPDRVEFSWREDLGSSGPSDGREKVAVGALRLLGLPNLKPSRAGHNVDVVHSCQALLLSSRPWVVDIEHALPFVGIHFDRLTSARVRRVITYMLTRGRCRAILPWTRTAAIGFTAQLGGVPQIEQLIRVVPPACAVPSDGSERRRGTVSRFLFVANRPEWNFVLKGGRELLEAFALIRRRHPETALTIVSPGREYAGGAASQPGVDWRGLVSRAELDALYRSADVFVMPSFSDTFGMVYLEAMSRRLPIIALDRPYTRDIVVDGQSGLLAPLGEHSVRWSDEDGRFTLNSDAFIARMLAAPPDEVVVRGVADRLARLIEDPEYARVLGEHGYADVSNGRFSIGHRNRQLREVYETARDSRP